MTRAAPVVILLSPPGASKGTQARMLEQDFGLVQLSTGDLLRHAVAAGAEAGQRARSLMEAGHLVPDGIVTEILRDRMARPDVARGVVLDGFPRTAAQAAALDGMLADRGQRVTAVISLEVEDEAMIDRVAGRHSCATCGEGYHDRFKAPVTAGICDRCGGTGFTRRADDTATAVRERLVAYHAQTAPLIAHYERLSVLERVPAMGSIASIRDRLADIVGRVSA